jgi:hypothetical protein
MRRRQYAVFGILLAVFALSALANEITTATGTADCSGYAVTVNLNDLTTGVSYTVTYSLTLTCGTTTTPITGQLGPFTATGSTSTQSSGTLAWPTTPLTTSCTVTGTATLVNTGQTVTITFNGQTSVPLTCGGTACPATIGFWKNHNFPNSVQTSGLTIDGITYSASDLETILTSPSHGNAVLILGKQLIGALLNLAAGAKHNATADAAIALAEAALTGLDLRTAVVDSSTTQGAELLLVEPILDNYNSADFHTCSENSGLATGT